MKILVIGASGLVGSHVLREGACRGHEVLGTFRTHPADKLVQCDLADMRRSQALLEEFQPDSVVHAAGWTWVDGCEGDAERAFVENCTQPAWLAGECASRQIHFTYFSTTYVFNGNQGLYREDDEPDPINVYSRSKFEAEQQIQAACGGRALVPRIICVWGREDQEKNFVYQVVRSLRTGVSMTIPLGQWASPTWAGDIAAWTVSLVEEKESGVWHMANGLRCSRREWLNHVLAGLRTCGVLEDAGPEFAETSAANGQQAARRPDDASCCVEKIQSRFPRRCREPWELDVLGL